MFAQLKNKDFAWPVVFATPVGDKTVEQTFDGTFERLEQADIEKLDQDQLVRRAIKGWDERVTEEDGKPLPFNADNLDRLLQLPGMRYAIFVAYIQAMNGQARRKN